MRAGIAYVTLFVATAIANGQSSPFPDPPIVAPPPVLAPIAPSIMPPSIVMPTAGQASPPPAIPTTVLTPTPMESVLTPHYAVGQQHTVGVEVQFGVPSGVRLQYAIYHGGGFSILAEAFAGNKETLWGEQAVLGVGGRAQFTLLSDGNSNALLVGPGIGVSYWQAEDRHRFWDDNRFFRHFDERDRYFMNFDTNIGWLHDLSPSLGWEIGINLGLRVGLSGHDRCGRDISGKIDGGTVGLYTGLRF